jgi:hypothetical protein
MRSYLRSLRPKLVRRYVLQRPPRDSRPIPDILNEELADQIVAEIIAREKQTDVQLNNREGR